VTTFEAESRSDAEQPVGNDPFLRGDLIERYWTKEMGRGRATHQKAPSIRV
jgi:hypothetical protein